MASVKLEDCSQTLELNVNFKDEEEEEKIGKSVSQGKSRFYLIKFVGHDLERHTPVYIQCIRKVFR
ncbi:hypothetical protein J4Q44_G00051510, partial [Coregonus suidteri]